MKFKSVFEDYEDARAPKKLEILKKRLKNAEMAIDYHENSEKGDPEKLKKHQEIHRKTSQEIARIRDKYGLEP